MSRSGVRVVCFDHSTLTWYKSRAYRRELRRDLDGRAWPWIFRQLVRFSRVFYWPSLHILARFAAARADHLLSPGVPGDELDEICRELHISPSRVTRFNVTVDMQRHADLSTEERAALRASMEIPIDALVIAIPKAGGLSRPDDLEAIAGRPVEFVFAPVDEILRFIRVRLSAEDISRAWIEHTESLLPEITRHSRGQCND